MKLLTAAEASASIAKRELSSRDIVDSCLDQIATREAGIQAWQFLDPADAVQQATAADSSSSTNPLRGIPIGIKDIIDTAEMPTTYGSGLFQGNRPAADATCVNKLRQAGMVILGKTVSTEFAYLQPSKTANPHDLARSPGGSSSGSAAAVAGCMVPVALATQTAGSCIRPASYCGVVGYKPTFGLFDTQGIMPLAQSLDTLSIMARSVRDIAMVAGQLSETLRLVSETAALASMRIGFADLSAEWREVYADSFAVYHPIKRKLADAGIPFFDVDLSEAVTGLHSLHSDILSFEAAGNFGELCDRNGGRISASINELVERGRAISRSDFEHKRLEAAQRRTVMDRVLDDWDVIVTPSAPGEAPQRETGTGVPIFNSLWTLLHVPCITIPALKGPTGMPVGIQLFSRRGADSSLLSCAEALAAVLGA